MKPNFGALVLAAGFSRRYGDSKLDAPLADGRPMVEHTLDAIATTFEQILIVTRPDSGLKLAKWPVTLCEGADQGMGASLAWGISRLPAWDGCLICLADMPFVQASTYRLLAEQLTPANIVIPTQDGRRGNPVGFGRRFFAELAELDGERGGREIIAGHPTDVEEIAVEDPAIFMDIDTPADLSRFRSGPSGAAPRAGD